MSDYNMLYMSWCENKVKYVSHVFRTLYYYSIIYIVCSFYAN